MSFSSSSSVLEEMNGKIKPIFINVNKALPFIAVFQKNF
jgi:hypothetical protein